MKNTEIEISCDICLDLIPLVNDQVASEDSRASVLHHIEHCETCKAEYHGQPIDYQINDQKIIRTIRKSMWMLGCGCLVLGALGGVSLTDGMGMFYNFLIMPIVGALASFIFKKKSIFVAISIFLWTFCWNGANYYFSDPRNLNISMVVSALAMALIYTFLVLLGMLIMKLLSYAFQKRG